MIITYLQGNLALGIKPLQMLLKNPWVRFKKAPIWIKSRESSRVPQHYPLEFSKKPEIRPSVIIPSILMNQCPCCSNTLLRQVRHGRVNWFCSHCWIEVPPASTENHPVRSRRPIVHNSLISPKFWLHTIRQLSLSGQGTR